MTQLADYTICLIRSAMQETPAPAIPEGITVKALFDFSRTHSLEALVGRALSPLLAGSSEAVWQQWRSRMDLLLSQSIIQLQERDDLIRLLTEAGICLMPIKGCWLKELYPDINDRQMCDLDMLIHPEDAAAAEAVLLQAGYRREDTCLHHISYFKPPNTALELHTRLLSPEEVHSGYFEDPWEKAEPVPGFPRLFRLRAEDEYLFYLVHLYKHLYNGGTGIRSILDQFIFSRSFPNMDREYLEQELNTLGLAELARQVQTLSRCWFETGGKIPESLQPLAQILFRAGTYGNPEVQASYRMEQVRKKHRNPVIRVLAYCLPRIFCPLSVMQRSYPILNRLPVLLPVFWVVRIFAIMLAGGRNFWRYLWLIVREGGRDD